MNLTDTLNAYIQPEGARAYLQKEAQTEVRRQDDINRLLDNENLQGKRVLDLGCGFGRDVAEMRRRGADAHGVDASEALLAEARRRYGDGLWHCADILTLEQPPVENIDILWSYALLVHVPRAAMPGLLRRWAGWLKPGGRMILFSKAGEGEKVYTNMGANWPRLMVFYTANEISVALQACGMKVTNAAVTAYRAAGDEVFEVKAEKI
jgi:2-polyprenyl-3-methyl-5-hydroxy-6-metoxy-1,4-benzoquinol methylase